MKNLIRNAIRSFKSNKISLIGLIFLLFFGLGAFVTMSNTTANIKNEYTSISSEGKLHDFTASELYEVGSAGYKPHTRGISFVSDGSALSNYKTYSVQDFIAIKGLSTNTLYNRRIESAIEIPAANTYYIPVPEQVRYDAKTEEGENQYTFIRTYHITLDKELSTGLFGSFADHKAGTTYTNFSFKTSQTIVGQESDIPSDIANLQTLLNN